MRIDIKPLSVNRVWQGKRFKTPAYKAYEQELMLKLKPLNIPDGDLSVYYDFGMTTLSDWDNPIKPFQDVLQKYYGFDDRRILKAVVIKTVVKKGEEYIDFHIGSISKC